MCFRTWLFSSKIVRKSAQIIKTPSIYVGIMPTVQTWNNMEWNFSFSVQYGRYLLCWNSYFMPLLYFDADYVYENILVLLPIRCSKSSFRPFLPIQLLIMSTLVIAPSFANQMYIFCMYPNASKLQKLTTRFAGPRYKVKRWNRGIYRSVNLGHSKMDLCSDLFPKVWKKDKWHSEIHPDIEPHRETMVYSLKEKVFETPYCKTITQLEERIRQVW